MSELGRIQWQADASLMKFFYFNENRTRKIRLNAVLFNVQGVVTPTAEGIPSLANS